MVCNTGVTRSIALSSLPPIISVSVPACAPGMPPDTGASISVTPAFASISASCCVPVGSDELMSTTIVPLASAPLSSMSSTTSRTIGPVGSMVTMTFDALATAAASAVPSAPGSSLTNFATRFLSRSNTCSLWSACSTLLPALRMFLAIGQPILPMPMKPTRRSLIFLTLSRRALASAR